MAQTTADRAEPKASPRPRVRSKTRHQDMLVVAARELNRRGPSLTSLKDIAETLNVSRRALYHYIEDRDDLVYQSYIRTLDSLRAAFDEASGAGGSAPDIVTRFMDIALDPAKPELCAITEPGLLPPEKRARVDELHDELTLRLARLLEAGARAGDIRMCDFNIAAHAILGVISWLPLSSLWSRGIPDKPRAEEIAIAKDFVLRGWAADRRAIPDYARIDISSLGVPTVEAFDREALAEAKREKILATASRLFNRKGIDTTSLEEIAQELNATPRAIYQHIGDKQALVGECYFRTMRMATSLQQLPGRMELPATVAMMTFQHAWALAQMRDDLSPLIPMSGVDALTPEAREHLHNLSYDMTTAAVEWMKNGMANGNLRQTDTYMTRFHSGAQGWLTKGEITDPARQTEAAHEIACFIAFGIGALDGA